MTIQSKVTRDLQPCGPACKKLEKTPGCIQWALRIVGDKWTGLIIARLVGEADTFLSLQELLPGISPRTLSARLALLMEEKIISAELYCKKPKRYRYSLTDKGKELRAVLVQMARWGERYKK